MPAIKGDMYINTHCNYSQPASIKLYNENIGGHLTPLHGRMRGSVGSTPHHGSWPVVLPFGCVWPLWSIWYKTLWLSVDHRLLKVKVKVWALAIAPLTWAALYNLGSGSWLAWANGAAAHYVAIHCPRWRTIGPTVRLADTPSPQSATLGLHLVAVAITHFPSRWG